MVTSKGTVVGKHDGLLFYTIGQGLRLPNQRAKYYVCEKRMKSNELVVCEGLDEALYKSSLIVGTVALTES